MSRKHQTAVDMIEARFQALIAKSTCCLHAETDMAIEMAYALGAISLEEHRHYVARRHRILEREHAEFAARFARSA
ncbi:hypothetical protein SAMN05216178_4019 [Pseudomonas saponiphila]|uniref:Uncharacterized protein n=1 Tax=Pseudomonas saponiphila TaxID=556534 RepID=A0A1H4R3J9_9PSED|nr:hypothetical protein [Pseudomonas saponiphila]SEC26304.1 hypothetical protein SAMN05216178_4019 [Pseudomonas saponiphila]